MLPGLGRGELLAISFQHAGQHAQRVPGLGSCGDGFAFVVGGDPVVAGQFRGRARARCRVGSFGRQREYVGHVGVGAAGQRDIGVLAVLGAGDHGQARGHGAALGDMVGDRVAQLGIVIAGVQELLAGPAPLPGARVGVQRAADDQPARGDGLDAEQVAVGQRPAGLPRLDLAVVAGADDQVPGAGGGAVGDAHRGPGADDAEADQVVADAAGQFPAQRVIGGHQQHIGTVQGQREVVGRGGVHHLLRVTAADPGVLVVFGQHRGITRAQPQAGRLFPPGAEPDRLGELDASRGRSASRDMPPPFSTACSWLVSPARITLAPLSAAWLMTSAMSGLAVMDASSIRIRSPGCSLTGPRAPRWPGRWPRNWAVLYDSGTPAARVLRADWDGVMPMTRPEPGRGPRPARRGQHPRFAGSGRCVDHRDALAVGQHRQRGRGLILAQPGPRARTLRVLRAAVQRGLELRQVRAERPRGVGAVHARRAARACHREHALFQGQLRVGGEPHAAVPLVDAAPVRAQQAARDLGRLRRLQAGHRLELRPQRPVSDFLQQRGGRGRVHAGPGQHPAQVLDHIRAGPGALLLLRQRDRLLRRAAHLQLAEDRAGTARAARARARVSPAAVVPYRRRDRRQAHAERARELVAPSPRAAA